MKEHELKRLLTAFRSLPAETEWLEFKVAKNNFHFDNLGKYFSALSNEANLKNRDFAWLIFGINDKTKNIEDSQFRPNRANLDSLKSEVANHTNGRITFVEIHELFFPEGRVIMFQIPAAPKGIPISWKGHYYGRDDEALQALNIQEIETIRSQIQNYDWSAQIVEDASISDLDDEAIAFARKQYSEKFPEYANRCKEWNDIDFLNKSGLTRQGKITRTSLILLGKIESAHFLLPAVPRIIWNLKNAKNIELDYQIFNLPFILVSDKVLAKIRILKHRYLRKNTLFPTEINQYDGYVLREILHNCIAHQDYEMGKRIQLIEFPDELLYINAGSFLAGTIEEVIALDAPPEQYRNPFLANAMHNLKMIDTQGGGIKRIFHIQKNRFFPLPDFELLPDRVRVKLYGKILDQNYTELLFHNSELDLQEVILLDKIQKKQIHRLSKKQIKELKSKGLIEGKRNPNYFIASGVAQLIGEEAEYIKNRGIEDDYSKKMILDYLKIHGSSKRSKIEDLLLPKLSAVLTIERKKNKVQNILQSLRKEGKIQVQGKYWELS